MNRTLTGTTLTALTALATACGTAAEPAPAPVGTDTEAAADLAVAPDGGTGDGSDGTPAGETAADAPGPDAPSSKVDQARVYVNDPKTDDHQTVLVNLTHPTDPDGHLIGDFAAVSNCLQQDGGAPLKFNGVTFGSMCVEQATAVRDDDGSYLSIVPPDDESEAEDKFAELMMYHHVNQIHDFFQDGFGLALKHNPIDALVNVTLNAAFDMGGGGAGWQGFPNAAFMPPEAFVAYGLPKKANGAIVFGQYKATDFSYDASVIYHEYTHAIVGTTRLSGVLVDTSGLDNLPGAMNEGFADYFSCSRRDNSIIGPYALTFQGDFYVRDLAKGRKCPDDLTSEVHADGKIIGSAMWEIRQALGQQQADQIILNALQSFTQSTNMSAAGKLIVAEAKKVDAATGKTVGDILKAHGVTGCERAKPWSQFGAQSSVEKVPISIAGVDQIQQSAGFKDGVPGYFQFHVDVAAGQKAVTLAWRSQAGQSGLMGGGGSPTIQLALKQGSMALIGNDQILADAIVQGKADASFGKNWQSVTLSGACLPAAGGRVYVMLLNQGNSGEVTNMDIKLLSATTGAVNVVTCAK